MADFIHRFIPAATGQNRTTLLLLHGTGGTEEDLVEIGRFLNPDAAILGVRGKVLENGMPRFFRRLAEGVFDEEDLTLRTHELARFVEECVDTYRLFADGIVAVGYSNGANIAASLMLLEPDVLSAAILFRAMVPLTPAALPTLSGKRVLMLSGRRDALVDAANSEQLCDMLSRAGADVTLHWTNGGHGLTNPEFSIAKSWLT